MANADADPTERWALRVTWILAPAVALLFLVWTDDPEAAWRYAGSVLELAGFGLVILDLELRLERFGDRTGPILTVIRKVGQGARWIGKKLGWKPPRTTVAASGSSHVSAGGSVNVSTSRAPYGPGLTGRVRRLEDDLGNLERRVDSVETKAAAERDELREEIGGEISELWDGLGEVRADLQQSVSSGIWLEFSGLLFFSVGVVFGTWGEAIF